MPSPPSSLYSLSGLLEALPVVTPSDNSKCVKVAPITRLSEDILYDIFEMVVLSEETPERPAHALNCLTHVCSSWRTVAMDSALLWACAVKHLHHNSDWVENMLMLTKNVELDIRSTLSPFRPKQSRGAKNILLALDHLPRIRQLNIEATSGHWPRFMEKMDNAASSLRMLSLRNLKSADPVSLPASLFSCATQLQSIGFHNFNVPWDLPILRNLTSLTICGVAREARVSLSVFIKLLGESLHMEQLTFENALDHNVDLPVSSLPVVHLPLLSHLTLGGDFAPYTALLSRISFPRTSSVDLKFVVASSSEACLKLMLAPLSGTLGNDSLSSLHITAQRDQFELAAWESPCATSSQLETLPLVRVLFRWRGDEESRIARAFPYACSMIALSPITYVKIDACGLEVSKKRWKEMFTTIPRTETLDVAGFPVGLFRALQQRSGSEALALLRMQELVVRYVDFSSEEEDERPQGYLLDTLFCRRRRRGKLAVLRLRDCEHVDEDSVRDLSQVVDKVVVECDGRESSEASADDEGWDDGDETSEDEDSEADHDEE